MQFVNNDVIEMRIRKVSILAIRPGLDRRIGDEVDPRKDVFEGSSRFRARAYVAHKWGKVWVTGVHDERLAAAGSYTYESAIPRSSLENDFTIQNLEDTLLIGPSSKRWISLALWHFQIVIHRGSVKTRGQISKASQTESFVRYIISR